MPRNSLERIDSDDLRRLASASKALLGSVARDARDVLAERRRERKAEERKADERKADERKADERKADERQADMRKADERDLVPAPPFDARLRGWRFKRRWVVVPVLTTVVLVVMLLVGAGLALAALLGLL